LSLISDNPQTIFFFIVNLVTLENICIRKIVLKYNSKEEAGFLLSISKELSQLGFYTLDSVVDLKLLFKVISELFANC